MTVRKLATLLVGVWFGWLLVFSFETWAEQRVRPEVGPRPVSGVENVAGERPAGPSNLLHEIKYGMILSAADLCGVEPGLAIALGMRESSLVWPERRHEAVGYYQVKPSTAAGVSRGLNVHQVWGNALAGLCYLRSLKDKEGTWEAALLSYRLGPHRSHTTRGARAYVADIMEGIE